MHLCVCVGDKYGLQPFFRLARSWLMTMVVRKRGGDEIIVGDHHSPEEKWSINTYFQDISHTFLTN